MRRVLIVDDERELGEALSELLEGDYSVRLAHSGEEALRILGSEDMDVVLVDLMMPEMDGEALIAELRARHITVPVIVSSAAHDLAERAKRSQATDFIEKPFDFDVLEKKLAAALAIGKR